MNSGFLVKLLSNGWLFDYFRIFIRINLESSWLVEWIMIWLKLRVMAWIEIGAFVTFMIILPITFIIMKLRYLEVHLRYGLMVILMNVTRGEITELPLTERVRVMFDVLGSYSSFLCSLIELICSWSWVWCVFIVCCCYVLFVCCVLSCVVCCILFLTFLHWFDCVRALGVAWYLLYTL